MLSELDLVADKKRNRLFIANDIKVFTLFFKDFHNTTLFFFQLAIVVPE
ncbi:MAG: hypothetical protein AB4040_17560 [Synechococcus sp.]